MPGTPQPLSEMLENLTFQSHFNNSTIRSVRKEKHQSLRGQAKTRSTPAEVHLSPQDQTLDVAQKQTVII